VYVPSESNGQAIPNRQQFVDETLTRLSLLCGGATSTEATGSWVSEDGRLVKEKVTLVYAFTNELPKVLPDIVQFAQTLKERTQQESLALELAGTLYLI